MDTLKSVSFFCPAFNEQENIEKAIKSVLPVLKEVASEFEIIIIDNCSQDRTAQIADEFANKFPEIRVIHHATNREYGGALKSGFKNAKYEYVVYTDSDNQYDFSDFKKMIPYLKDFDIVTGYRQVRHDAPYRLFQSRIFNKLINLFFGLRLRDINCSFKVYKKKVLDNIDIRSRSTFIDAEMFIWAKSKGFSIVEVPVSHFPRLAGKSTGAKPHVIFITIKEILSYWFEFQVFPHFKQVSCKRIF